MKWRGRERSRNIDDRRGSTNPFRRSGASAGRRRPAGMRTTGGGLGLVVVLVIVAMALGINPMTLLDGTLQTDAGAQVTQLPPAAAGDDDLAQFVGVVVKETEDQWGRLFADAGQTYVPPTVVLFSGQDRSACGLADARTGPFYCPADRKVYIDLSFYDQLRQQFGAPGDFAQAYVLAHEIGHHVQNLTGVLPEFNAARPRLSAEEANAWSVRVELQADCYAGVWAARAGQDNLLDAGDIDEALNAANQIGDDVLQKRAQGFAVPKTFSHGTAEQRKRWFSRGYAEGDPAACDTMGTARL